MSKLAGNGLALGVDGDDFAQASGAFHPVAQGALGLQIFPDKIHVQMRVSGEEVLVADAFAAGCLEAGAFFGGAGPVATALRRAFFALGAGCSPASLPGDSSVAGAAAEKAGKLKQGDTVTMLGICEGKVLGFTAIRLKFCFFPDEQK